LFGERREGLNDDQRLIVSTVQGLAGRFGEAYWHRLDKERKYPDEFVAEMGRLGMAALPIPKEYGGAGYGVREASLVLEEINASGGNAQPFHGQYYLSFMVARFASEGLKARYLPDLATGKIRLQTFALTEPEAGSESTKIKSSAVKKNGNYQIRGHKIFISRLEHTDLVVLAARTTPLKDAAKKTEGISLFLVELKDSKGLDVRRIETMFNSQTYEVFIDGLEVPEGNLIGEEGQGFRYILGVLNPERILLASECIGDARWFVEKSVAYANSRVVFDRQIGSNQGVQFPIADTYAKMIAAEKVRWSAAEMYDKGVEDKTIGELANISKYLASECSWQAANVAMDVYGGSGVAAANHIERKFREARLYRVAPVPQNLVLAYIAQSVLGLPRSY
jgi:alkylation response protein AidB-like acyl-CoA dehydrogenase